MPTNLLRLCIVAVAAFVGGTTIASAEQVKVRTKTYAISGKDGAELYQSMVRRGPRHGFVSRAIAQTSYTVEWQAEVVSHGDVCRVVRAQPVLSITYTYPQPGRSMSPDMSRRWQRFMVGVKQHEQKHGAIAREMVRAAEASVKGLKISNDPGCRKTRIEVKKRADKVYAIHEARQLKFDAREHRDGGNIDRLILGLVKGR